MKKKYYVESGDHQKVLLAENRLDAAHCLVLRVFLECARESRPAILGKDVSVSEAGFVSDLVSNDRINDLIQVRVFSISEVFELF